MRRQCLNIAILSALSLPAFAGFDRPTLGFDTQSLTPGTVVLEQSLPNFESGSKHLTEKDTYSLDTLLRFGILPNIELQIGVQTYGAQPLLTQRKQHSSDDGNDYIAPTMLETKDGFGDGTLGVKWTSNLGRKNFSMGILANTNIDFGDYPGEYRNKVKNLGTTLKWQLPYRMSFGLYSNYQSSKFGDGWQVAPHFGFPIIGGLSGYLEAEFGEHYDQIVVDFEKGFPETMIHRYRRHDHTAGGGLVYAITPNLQLDLVVRAGIHDDTPDLQGGFGIGWAIP